jgi:rRNA maturation RNase YbeY
MNHHINFVLQGIDSLGIDQSHANWLLKVANSFNYDITELNYTFMSDDDLLELNKEYLQHDFYTDIITFDNTIGKTISADIAISVDRVKENSKSLEVTFDEELKRVMVHGLLHCIGFKDNSQEEKEQMRLVESDMLKMFHVEHI